MIDIIGIDLGLRKVHFAGLSIENREKVDLFSISTSKLATRDVEIKFLMNYVKQYYKGMNCPFFIEEPVLAGTRNIRVMLGMAQISGAVAVSLKGRGYFVPVSSWKKETVGKGNASKDEVRLWLSKQYKHYSASCERADSSQDFADATCVALYGSKMLGFDFQPH